MAFNLISPSFSSSLSNDSHQGSKEGTSTARKEPPLPIALLRSALLQRRRRRCPLRLLYHSNNKDRLSGSLERAEEEGSTIRPPGPPEPGLSVLLRSNEDIVDEKYRFDMTHFARPGDEGLSAAIARFIATKPPCFYQHESRGEHLQESASFF